MVLSEATPAQVDQSQEEEEFQVGESESQQEYEKVIRSSKR